ncbi:hypothetical protein ATZ36_07985 [Candidatus Endomicrobiellum trichonymphae]|uniref:Uncharacterized protein n=1 Tax=Endomicrobium trichonymphae TaxID=1408204 RepID=A0A1E5IGS1_ENDTX|nr:hypothetical protein ATZ36_07985 [Candidatus Endomicrobium trichonymphae]
MHIMKGKGSYYEKVSCGVNNSDDERVFEKQRLLDEAKAYPYLFDAICGLLTNRKEFSQKNIKGGSQISLTAQNQFFYDGHPI